MHYCFLTIGTWEGNASHVRLREFGNELAARGHDVTYIVEDIPYNREKLTLHPKAKIVLVPNRGLKSFFIRRKTVKQIGADYVHVLDSSIKFYLALAFSGQRVVADWDEWIAKRPLPFVRRMIEQYVDRWARNRSVLAVVASKYLQSEFRKLGCESVYIPYAAYLQSYPDGESPFTEPTFVYMGNLYSAYDHDVLFDAAVLLKKRGLQPRMAILGSGPELEKWREFVRTNDLPNISLPGFTTGETLWRHLRHARANLFPIRETPLNLYRCPSKTFAYAQARRPVITNRVGEVPEVLQDRAQYLPCTAEAFADAIEKMMRGPAPADVDFHAEEHNWAARTTVLLEHLPPRR